MKQRSAPARIVTQKSGVTSCATTTLPRELYDAFERMAHADGMTKSEKLRRLVEGYVEEAQVTK